LPRFSTPRIDVASARRRVAADKGYDSERVHAECETRGVAPVIPLRGYKSNLTHLPAGPICRLNPRIPRHSEEFSVLYRGRSAVEREFGKLKHDYGLGPLRVRGLERVQLHADLVMLGRLGQTLIRARAVALAA
jgi:DDE family transposase